MKLGMVTDALAAYSLPEAAAICRRLGLEQVELGCGNWSSAPHADLKTLTADGSARSRLLDTLGGERPDHLRPELLRQPPVPRGEGGAGPGGGGGHLPPGGGSWGWTRW